MSFLHRLERSVLLLFFVLFNLSLYAIDRKFKNFSVSDGLADMDILCLAQDSSGLIWLGTNAGIQNYDGYSFTTHDYYNREQKIYDRHNRILSMSCSEKLLWVGSESGLACIDLNTHSYTKYTADDCKEIHTHPVLRIDVDAENDLLWIYTNLRCYVTRVNEESRSLSFLRWENPEEYMQTKGKHSFREGRMWELGKNHLKCFVVEQNQIKVRRYPYPKRLLDDNDKLDALMVTSAYAYLRTESGCYRVPLLGIERIPDFTSSAYVSFHQLHFSIPEKTIDNFFVDERTGDLWCPYWGGLFHISKAFTNQASVHSYFRNTEDVRLSRIKISSTLLDRYDNLWIGTSSWGLYCKSLHPLPFHEIPKEKFLEKGFYRTEVTAVAKQNPDKVWMIVESSSLFCYNEKSEKLTLIPLDINKEIPSTLQSLHVSANGKFLYIGMLEGLLRYEIATGKTLWIIGKNSVIVPLEINIFQIREDRWGRLWAGSWYKGIYCFESPEHKPSLTYHISDYTVPTLTTGHITDIRIGNDCLMLATSKGLNKIILDEDGKIQKISNYQVNKLKKHSISSNCLSSIDIENDSICWVGTIGGGLNKIILHSAQQDDYTATVYTQQEGLVNNNIDIVFYDNNGNVWTGGNGISCLNTHTGKITSYDTDKLQVSVFKLGAGFQSSDGTIYMGGTDGMNYFQPKDFIEKKDTVNLIWSDLYINNQLITPLENNILKKTLNKTKVISLSYNQNDFSVSFSALGYQFSDKITYRYRLYGHETEWNELTYKENRIYYTNVPYGQYTLEIQVSTDNGDTWHFPGRSLIIKIEPPLWLCWWAKLLYIIASISIIIIILYQYNKAQKLRRNNHIQEIFRKKDKERYQSKMIFFMNLSHELKTPLALIMLAVERMNGTHFQKETQMILSNAKKILQLITEMVDIRKTDLNINELNIEALDMQDITAQIVHEMTYLAKDKDIEMAYLSSEEYLLMNADRDRIGKMVVNICSNAVKYTPRNGKIKVSLSKGKLSQVTPLYKNVHTEGCIKNTDELCLLTVHDSGVGISAESIHHIYERFFQVKGEESSHLGSGIGLAIVKNVVLLHEGMIMVSSERGKGTEFMVALPLKYSQEKATMIQKFKAKPFIENQYAIYKPGTNDIQIEGTKPDKINPEWPILLIVEDNKELQSVLSEHFSAFYNVRVANNGREGLEICELIMPDIIVSDIMMPEMDGIEMCRQIRNNLSIAYLPIVLLTAKNEVDDQIEGYESGADLYLSKPFSIKLLEVSLRQLLEKKRLIFCKEIPAAEVVSSSPTLIETFTSLNHKKVNELINTEDSFRNLSRQALLENEKEAFRLELYQLIDENLSNPELSVDFFCQQMCMGKTKLWQRVKECCGESLAEHVRNIRLEKAAVLLRESTMNITEIKYKIGYTNSSHFTRAFKQKFGVSPSDYLKQLKDQ